MARRTSKRREASDEFKGGANALRDAWNDSASGDGSGGDFGDMIEVPSGKFRCQLVAAKVAEFGKEDKLKAMVKWIVVNGEHRGKFITDFWSLFTPKSVGWVKKNLKRMGAKPSDIVMGDDPEDDLQDLFDGFIEDRITVIISVEGEEDDGSEFDNRNAFIRKLVAVDDDDLFDPSELFKKKSKRSRSDLEDDETANSPVKASRRGRKATKDEDDATDADDEKVERAGRRTRKQAKKDDEPKPKTRRSKRTEKVDDEPTDVEAAAERESRRPTVVDDDDYVEIEDGQAVEVVVKGEPVDGKVVEIRRNTVIVELGDGNEVEVDINDVKLLQESK